jgi:hypothetical protein
LHCRLPTAPCSGAEGHLQTGRLKLSIPEKRCVAALTSSILNKQMDDRMESSYRPLKMCTKSQCQEISTRFIKSPHKHGLVIFAALEIHGCLVIYSNNRNALNLVCKRSERCRSQRWTRRLLRWTAPFSGSAPRDFYVSSSKAVLRCVALIFSSVPSMWPCGKHLNTIPGRATYTHVS